jgi:carboxypeptidase A2
MRQLSPGIHAREWISPATATYFIKQLTKRNSENADMTEFFDFFVLPVANPDG